MFPYRNVLFWTSWQRLYLSSFLSSSKMDYETMKSKNCSWVVTHLVEGVSCSQSQLLLLIITLIIHFWNGVINTLLITILWEQNWFQCTDSSWELRPTQLFSIGGVGLKTSKFPSYPKVSRFPFFSCFIYSLPSSTYFIIYPHLCIWYPNLYHCNSELDICESLKSYDQVEHYSI